MLLTSVFVIHDIYKIIYVANSTQVIYNCGLDCTWFMFLYVFLIQYTVQHIDTRKMHVANKDIIFLIYNRKVAHTISCTRVVYSKEREKEKRKKKLNSIFFFFFTILSI